MVEENRELRKMYEEDVEEKTNADWNDKKTVAMIKENDKRRKKRAEEIISQGGLKVASDYHHVALILQHGETTTDYKKAKELAKIAMERWEMKDQNGFTRQQWTVGWLLR